MNFLTTRIFGHLLALEMDFKLSTVLSIDGRRCPFSHLTLMTWLYLVIVSLPFALIFHAVFQF